MARQRTHDLHKHPLDASLMSFNIIDLLKQIKNESVWQKGKRNAMTLLKSKGLRVLLVGDAR